MRKQVQKAQPKRQTTRIKKITFVDLKQLNKAQLLNWQLIRLISR